MIQEAFLHFIWQKQYFNKTELLTHQGDVLVVQDVGIHNRLAGPDFLEAKVSINGILWAGAVEIHIYSSHWYLHQHQHDPNYENVVLHVVYELDKKVLGPLGQEIPTLELKGLIKPKMLDRYHRMLEQEDPIPCTNSLPYVNPIVKLSMLEKTLISRMESKSLKVYDLLKDNNIDWEETAYQWLARGLGFKVNAEAMLNLAKSVPVRFLRKHHDLKHLEAMLFGASGLLNIDVKDDYLIELKHEYQFLKSKYNISEKGSFGQWHFSGVRPGNYPTIRIAQLAALILEHQNIFSLFTEFKGFKDLDQKLSIMQSSYWQTHYMPDKHSKRGIGGLTKAARVSLLINITTPLLVAFAKHQDKFQPLEKALNLLMSLPREENRITRMWKELGWNVSSAFDSQGLIELYNEYCSKKRCIECNIGVSIVRS